MKKVTLGTLILVFILFFLFKESDRLRSFQFVRKNMYSGLRLLHIAKKFI